MQPERSWLSIHKGLLLAICTFVLVLTFASLVIYSKLPTIQSSLGVTPSYSVQQFLLTLDKPLSKEDNKKRSELFLKYAQSSAYIEVSKCHILPVVTKISKTDGIKLTNSSSEGISLELSSNETISVPGKTTIQYFPQMYTLGSTGYFKCNHTSPVVGAFLITK